MDAEQLRHALIEAGFTEAAAMVGADVEAQALEGDEELDNEVVRSNFGGSDDHLEAA